MDNCKIDLTPEQKETLEKCKECIQEIQKSFKFHYIDINNDKDAQERYINCINNMLDRFDLEVKDSNFHDYNVDMKIGPKKEIEIAVIDLYIIPKDQE